MISKRFVFLVFLSVFSFGSINIFAGDDQQKINSDTIFKLFNQNHQGKDLLEQTMYAIRNGYLDGMRQAVREVSGNFFLTVGSSLKRLKFLLYSYVHRLAYNNRPLHVPDLLRISKHIYTLCLPFAKFSPGNMNRERRAQAFLSPQDLLGEETPLEDNWQELRTQLVAELNYAIAYLKRALPAHSIEYLNAAPGGLQEKLALMLSSLSVYDDLSVSFYIVRAMTYLDNLIRLLNSFNSLEEAQQKFEETQRWLNYVVQSFEQISHFLEPEAIGKNSFVRAMGSPNQGGGGMPSLEALLGQLNGGNS